MTTIEIKFPADRTDIAAALGQALVSLGAKTPVEAAPPPKPTSASTAEPSADTPPVATADAAVGSLDENGVAFDEAMCCKSAVPFYTTGAKKGQWKKRVGVGQQAYDAWYASVLPTKTTDAGSMFEGTPAEPEPEEYNGPVDAGALMVWVSGEQAAGRLAQEQVNEAWQQAGVKSPAELFSDDAAPTVRKVYEYLAAQV